VRLDELDYALPPDRIAQHPAPERDGSRLLVLQRGGAVAGAAGVSGELVHAQFRDLPDHLAPDDLLVVNDTRVLPSRLIGAKETGGRIEILLVEREDPGEPPGTPMDGRGPADARPASEETWLCLAGFSRAPAPGAPIDLGPHLRARWAGPAPGELHRIRLSAADGGSLHDALALAGTIPLPPYIARTAGAEPSDRERYQTIYAEREGAIAAPTAGLHFTPALLRRLEERGIGLARVTLHVGPATFLPVRTEEIEDHPMDAERYEVPRATVAAIAEARARGGRVVAVGTTAVRALESAATGRGGVVPAHGRTDLFILPGYAFRVVDALITNFHLPRSTLLAMVAAFAGRERILGAYAEAVARGYRFYSYGDAMLIL
jgi:S-adenosylmethionine:tRNA ribosyltransferase-isomerase